MKILSLYNKKYLVTYAYSSPNVYVYFSTSKELKKTCDAYKIVCVSKMLLMFITK